MFTIKSQSKLCSAVQICNLASIKWKMNPGFLWPFINMLIIVQLHLVIGIIFILSESLYLITLALIFSTISLFRHFVISSFCHFAILRFKHTPFLLFVRINLQNNFSNKRQSFQWNSNFNFSGKVILQLWL